MSSATIISTNRARSFFSCGLITWLFTYEIKIISSRTIVSSDPYPCVHREEERGRERERVKILTGLKGGLIILFKKGANSSCNNGFAAKCLQSPGACNDAPCTHFARVL